jgi:xanthine dehydrogenase accessory factor
MTSSPDDSACDVAHGTAPASAPGEADQRVLVAVFASPVADFLLRYGHDLGYRTVLVEPELRRARHAAEAGVMVETAMLAYPAGSADVVVTDHHRPELGIMLRDALDSQARWVGILGNPRHPAPHIPALAELGVPEDQISQVHRPVGLNIGSRAPAEIAIATLAGLIASRNGRPGGFEF